MLASQHCCHIVPPWRPRRCWWESWPDKHVLYACVYFRNKSVSIDYILQECHLRCFEFKIKKKTQNLTHIKITRLQHPKTVTIRMSRDAIFWSRFCLTLVFWLRSPESWLATVLFESLPRLFYFCRSSYSYISQLLAKLKREARDCRIYPPHPHHITPHPPHPHDAMIPSGE